MDEYGVRSEVDRALETVASVMQQEVIALPPDQSLDEAIRDLERTDVSGAPVVEHGAATAGALSAAGSGAHRPRIPPG